jgi:hypothetical protein
MVDIAPPADKQAMKTVHAGAGGKVVRILGATVRITTSGIGRPPWPGGVQSFEAARQGAVGVCVPEVNSPAPAMDPLDSEIH